jgi:signal transduction histidine kinase
MLRGVLRSCQDDTPGKASAGEKPVKRKSSLVQKGSEKLRPRARIIRAIGEDLISNETIALVELIKNSYHADAHKVAITFESPLLVGQGAILLQDDGHGMTREVLKSAWLEPATISKKDSHRSPGGRRVTGEKGLGRFAAARLADRMHVESIALNPHRRVVADFDWGEFRKDERFLDEVCCDWEEHRVDTQAMSGTALRLDGLHEEWNAEAFRRLRSELTRLVARPREKDHFEIGLNLPTAFKDQAGPITPPPILGRPQYTLTGALSAEGHLVGTVVSGDKATAVDEVVTVDKGRSPKCGPFEFEFRIWDRDRDALDALVGELQSTVRDLRRDLDAACGVSIYRDSFRVLPYGGPANDWLRLDLRRVQNPTMRLSNNQIVGAIHISADGNQQLRDQTNREGLVESPALDDLRRCVVEILTHLEKVRYERRYERERGGEDRSGLGLFRDLDFKPVKDSFKERYPEDKEFLQFLTNQEQTFQSSIKQVQKVIVRYRRLATLGQLIDVVLHDGRTPVASISNECDLARRDLKSAKDWAGTRDKLLGRLDTIGKQTEVLSSLFRRIAPFGGRKRGRPVEQPIEKPIADAFAIFARSIGELGVRITLPTSRTLVTADAAEMQQIFVNLLDNALFWLGKVPAEHRAIAIQCRLMDGGIEILFCDSGPGVPDDVRDYIFDAYYSAKPDGVGLGLTIAGEIATEYDGSLELVSPGLLSGANFRVVLRKRVSASEEE